MDQIIYKHGISFLRWKDENGNTWEAELDSVKFFGKECFEQMPNPEEIFLGGYSVCYNDEFIDYDPVTNEEWNEIINL